jgi:hypothetical protein
MNVPFDLDLFKAFASKEYESGHPGITEKYTEEERKIFYLILSEEHKKSAEDENSKVTTEHIEVATGAKWRYSQSLYSFYKEFVERCYPINKHYLSDGYDLVEAPLEDMPVSIHDECPQKRAVALWRLKIGR